MSITEATSSTDTLPTYFGYMGSKGSISEELMQRMPPEAYKMYCDVFAGGLGLFLKKKKAREQNICNDRRRHRYRRLIKRKTT